MNAAPNPPSDFKAIVSDPTNTLCGNFVNIILKLPALIWQFMNWMLDSNGNVSNTFKQQIIPPGFLMHSAAPFLDETAWLLCDGREVPKANYPDLYTAIQDIYGTASSTSNFKIPDLTGQFLVGVGSFDSGATVAVAQKVGKETVVLSADQMPPHTHDVNGLYAVGLTRASNSNGVTNNNGLGDAAAFTLTSESAGGVGTPPEANGHPNIPPATGVYIFIKV